MYKDVCKFYRRRREERNMGTELIYCIVFLFVMFFMFLFVICYSCHKVVLRAYWSRTQMKYSFLFLLALHPRLTQILDHVFARRNRMVISVKS